MSRTVFAEFLEPSKGKGTVDLEGKGYPVVQLTPNEARTLATQLRAAATKAETFNRTVTA